MAPDRPDYETNNNISAQSVGDLAIDVATQSLNNLGVDVEAQSVGDLAVDLATQSLSQLDVDIQSQSVGDLAVDLAAQSVGSLGVDIEAQTISDLGIDIQNQTVNLLDTAVESRREEDILFQTVQQSTTVAANGGSESITVRAPAGTILEVLALELRVAPPPNATSGEHQFNVRSETEFVDVLQGAAGPNGILRFEAGEWTEANVNQTPSTSAAQVQAVRGGRIDENNGIQVSYFNDTDDDTSRIRTHRFWFRKVSVA
jgi:hypothetical protein